MWYSSFSLYIFKDVFNSLLCERGRCCMCFSCAFLWVFIYTSTFNRFICNYKPSKVKHNVLAWDYIQDGNAFFWIVQSQCKALRLAWLERILNSVGWNDIINEYLSPYGVLAFHLRCIYDRRYLNHIPIFYRKVLDFANEVIIEGSNQNII